jgi:LytR cell envelope-related transcriptional attenuator
MSMDQPRRPTRAPGGPAGRSSRGSSPAIAVVVALVAAVLGFVILRSLDEDDSGTVSTGSGTESPSDSTATGDTGTVDSAATTVTTLPPVDKTQFNVLVANASGVKGSAGNLTTQLASLGYKTLAAANATDPASQTSTVVYYVIGAEAIGADVANAIGKTASPMPATLPVAQTDFVGGHVLIMLGTDLAGKAIPGATSDPTASTAAPTAGVSPNSSTG